MKNRMNQMFALALAGLIALMVTGCGSAGSTGGCTTNCGGGGGGETITAITGAAFESAGEPKPYPYTCTTSTGAGCTWSSSNTSYLTIDASTGDAMAVAAGTVTITATATDDSSVSKTMSITVGNRMVYHVVTDEGQLTEIFTINVDTGATTQLSSLSGTDPTFFAGQQQLIFTTNAKASNEFEIAATDGTVNGVKTSPTVFTFSTVVGVDYATPCGDGTVVFMAQDIATGDEGYYSASTTAGDTPTPMLLYQNPSHSIGLGQPTCSHDGTLIVHERVSGYTSDLWVMNVDGTNPSQITWVGVSRIGKVGDATFSADDKTIYYPFCDLSVSNCPVYAIPANNTDQTNSGTLVGGDGMGLTLSPNGQLIGVSSVGSGGFGVLNINSGQQTAVPSTSSVMGHPSWN